MTSPATTRPRPSPPTAPPLGGRRFSPRTVRQAYTPMWPFAAYVFFIPTGSAIKVPIALPAPFNSFGTVLGSIVGALTLLTLISNGHRRRTVPPIELAAWLALAGWVTLTLTWTMDRSDSFEGVLVLFSVVVLSTVVALLWYTPRELAQLEFAMVASVLATGLLAFYQWRTGGLATSETGSARFGVVGGDPNITAAALTLPMAVCMEWIFGADRRRNQRWFAGVCLLAGMVAISLTASRGGLVSLAAVLLVVVAITRGPVPLLAGAAAIVATFLFVPFPAFDRIEAGSTGRTAIWQLGMVGCEERCWYGVGFRAFRELFRQLLIEHPELTDRATPLRPHNLWIGSLIELGVIGVLLVGAVVAIAVARAWPLPDKRKVGVFAGLGGVLIANLFISNLEFKYMWVVLVVCLLQSDWNRTAGRALPSRDPAQPVPLATRSVIRTARRRWWAVPVGAAIGLAVALAVGQATDDRLESRALVIATDLDIRTDDLPVTAQTIFTRGDVAEAIVDQGGFAADGGLIPDRTDVEPVPGTVALYVVGRAADAAEATDLANVAAAVLIDELEAAEGIGTFKVLYPAVTEGASPPAPFPAAPLGVVAAVASWAALVAAIHGYRRPMNTLTDLGHLCPDAAIGRIPTTDGVADDADLDTLVERLQGISAGRWRVEAAGSAPGPSEVARALADRLPTSNDALSPVLVLVEPGASQAPVEQILLEARPNVRAAYLVGRP